MTELAHVLLTRDRGVSSLDRSFIKFFAYRLCLHPFVSKPSKKAHQERRRSVSVPQYCTSSLHGESACRTFWIRMLRPQQAKWAMREQYWLARIPICNIHVLVHVDEKRTERVSCFFFWKKKIIMGRRHKQVFFCLYLCSPAGRAPVTWFGRPARGRGFTHVRSITSIGHRGSQLLGPVAQPSDSLC